MSQDYKNQDTEGDAAILTQERVEIKHPRMYAVIMLNDDFTPMDFVIYVLQSVFKKSIEEATRMMLQVHTEGQSKIGVYPYDIANTKVHKVHELAKREEHPLQCVLEPEDKP